MYRNIIIILFVTIICKEIYCIDLPTNYEYYTNGGIKSGLIAEGNHFTLNGKEIRILSGSFHYFRVLPEQWKDRLMKFKAAGLNAVQIYVPWNLHEEIPGHFNFEGILDLGRFLKEVKENDMFVMFRVGPYICAEWEMGGFPSWLLRDEHLHLRTNYAPYLKAIEKYFEKLIAVVKNHQFSVNGGPIIAVQIENEYAGPGNTNKSHGDYEYIKFLKDTLTKFGIRELYFACDGNRLVNKDHGTIPGVLLTENFNYDPKKHLHELLIVQPNRPLYVSEFWSGWFDNWGDYHHRWNTQGFIHTLNDIVFTMNASVNFYMFIGGTNFGFMNGGRVTTSYDYNAPLSEAGDYTEKYNKTKELIEKLIHEKNLPKIKVPALPQQLSKGHYGKVKITDYIPLDSLLTMIKPIELHDPVPMELLNLGPDHGQAFGFINYRTKIPVSKNIKILGVADRAVVLIDKNVIGIVEGHNNILHPTKEQFSDHNNEHVLDILVENMGRVNGGSGMNTARKGINDKVQVDDVVKHDWNIYTLEFKMDFVKRLNKESWKKYENNINTHPGIYRAALQIDGEPKDTFVKLSHPWIKGNVFVNGFNIGRYWEKGPQKTLYVPAPLLKKGHNDIYVFELHSSSNEIEFIDYPIL